MENNKKAIPIIEYYKYKDLLIKERIKKYPEKPYSKIIDLECDLEKDIYENFENGV